MKIDIGLNTCCFTRRWEEPENWMRLTKEAGFPYFQLDSDMIDPFFSGDRETNLRFAGRVRKSAEKLGLIPTTYYTGIASYRFHGIAHTEPSARQRMRQWIIEAMDIALAGGMKKVGGRFDAYSVEVLACPERFAQQLEQSINLYRELSVIGRQKGIEEIELEQMYVPSLYPYSIAQTEDYLVCLNRHNRDGCRLSTTVDVGHMCSQKHGGTGDDLLYEKWLERFAPVSEDIHLQQTDRGKSDHNPFTPKDNAAGDVHIERILEAICTGHRLYAQRPEREYLEPVTRNLLILEYIPASSDTDQEILDRLGESARYLRTFIPEGGIEMGEPGM